VLDLLVHRPDLPVLPDNLGNLALLGFGLWQAPLASAGLELVLVVAGAYLYYRSAMQLTNSSGATPTSAGALTASGVAAGLLLLVSNLLGL
jgi:hypothetical protein